MTGRSLRTLIRASVLAAILTCSAPPVVGQPPIRIPMPAPPPRPVPAPAPRPAPTPAAPDDEGGLTVRDTSVGYIDNPLPADQFILRYDTAYGFHNPNRAEFFYAQGAPGGPGVPLPERRLDYQDVAVYLESRVCDRASVFAELPVRFLNPEVNANTAGLGDMNVGLKAAVWQTDRAVATAQFRTYIPSGNPHRGLGNSHASLEPGLLGGWSATDRLTLVGELRYRIPVTGTDFAGDVLRYGLGGRYDLVRTGRVRVAPVLEAVGWEVLGGKERGLPPVGDIPVTRGSAGTSILNLKAGCRVDWCDRTGLYVGYGRALTGETWYEDVLRVEFRWLY